MSGRRPTEWHLPLVVVRDGLPQRSPPRRAWTSAR